MGTCCSSEDVVRPPVSRVSNSSPTSNPYREQEYVATNMKSSLQKKQEQIQQQQQTTVNTGASPRPVVTTTDANWLNLLGSPSHEKQQQNKTQQQEQVSKNQITSSNNNNSKHSSSFLDSLMGNPTNNNNNKTNIIVPTTSNNNNNKMSAEDYFHAGQTFPDPREQKKQLLQVKNPYRKATRHAGCESCRLCLIIIEATKNMPGTDSSSDKKSKKSSKNYDNNNINNHHDNHNDISNLVLRKSISSGAFSRAASGNYSIPSPARNSSSSSRSTKGHNPLSSLSDTDYDDL